jgi:hypothetical protein
MYSLLRELHDSEKSQIEIQDALSSQLAFFSTNYKQAFEEMKRLTSINANLMGHSNSQQKIRYLDKLKEERLKYKEVTIETFVFTLLNHVFIYSAFIFIIRTK